MATPAIRDDPERWGSKRSLTAVTTHLGNKFILFVIIRSTIHIQETAEMPDPETTTPAKFGKI